MQIYPNPGHTLIKKCNLLTLQHLEMKLSYRRTEGVASRREFSIASISRPPVCLPPQTGGILGEILV
jgi:hypothetical protein